MRSTTSRVAVVATGVLVLGIGMASGQESVDDPPGDGSTTTSEDGTTTTTEAEETTTTVEFTTTTVEEDESPEEGSDTEAVGDNHGAIVSHAAQDHSNDERCGNHGQWVRSVATGAEDCVVPPGLEDPAPEDVEGRGVGGRDGERRGPAAAGSAPGRAIADEAPGRAVAEDAPGRSGNAGGSREGDGPGK